MNINNLIDLTLNGNTDSSRHLMTLFSLVISIKAKNILELGVRDGGTTVPFLMALEHTGGNLTSVDINDSLKLREMVGLRENWKFEISDALTFLKNIKQNTIYDIVYIDDWHDGLHVKQELKYIENHITTSSLILLHDCMCYNTQPKYHFYKDIDGEFGNGGPWRAVKDLDLDIWEFVTIPVNNGLTILRKKDEEVVF